MPIITKLKTKNSYFSIKYFGKGDYSTDHNLSIVLSKKDIIKNYFNSKSNFNIKTYNNFKDYLFLAEQVKYCELKGSLNNEIEILNYLNDIKVIYIKYQNKDVISYINTNYKTIFKIEKIRYGCKNFEEFKEKYKFDNFQYDIEDLALDLVAKYISGINENVINYLVKYYLPEIYNKMSLFYGYFQNNYDKLLTKNNIERCVVNSNYGVNRIDDIAEFLVKLNDKQISITKYLDHFVKVLKDNYFSSSNVDFFQSHSIIQMLIPYLARLKIPYYNDFIKEEELQQQNIDKWLETNGQKFEYKIDLKPLVDFFDNNKIPLITKVLLLTHSHNKKTKKIESLFSTIKNMPVALTDDLFGSNIETNNYFKNSFQRNMHLQTDTLIYLLNLILSTQKRHQDLLTGLYTFQIEVLKKLNISIEEESIDDDFDIILYYLGKLFLSTIDDKSEEKALIYGLISFLCGSVEKLLRIVYKAENTNIYIKDSDITLGTLLDYENANSILLKILGVDTMRCMRFYLHNEKNDNRIGMNIRNEIDHLNLKKTHLDKAICLLVFRLYIDVVNSLFIYYCEPK